MQNNFDQGNISKEKDIARRLSEGTPAADLVRLGFNKGTVYKVAARLANEGATPNHATADSQNSSDPTPDPDLEADPDILELKKALRMAQLQRQLDELQGTPAVEDRVSELEQQLGELSAALEGLRQEAPGSPLSGLRRRFKCECGSSGKLAIPVECTSCGNVVRHGWW